MATKPRPALLPKSLVDPTGMDSLERSAMREFSTRINKVLRAYKDALERIPAEPVVNAKYTFRLDSFLLGTILAQLDAEVNAILLEGGEQSLWFTESYVAVAAARGTSQAYHNLAVQSPAYREGRGTIAQLLNSQPYIRRMALVRAREFEEMKGLTGNVKANMGRVLTDGIGRGLSPREIARSLTEQAGIEKGRANRIARTEITTALRRARWDETEDAKEEFGFYSKEMHLSALSPSTRRSHAARHSKLFDIEEVREWWAKDANSINCYLPGTQVAGRFVAGSKAMYTGEAINIVTASGRKVSVTANHPVLTNRGLISAAKVAKGDYLFRNSVEIKDASGVVTLNNQEVYSSVEDVFRALAESGSFGRVRVSAVDFHGDGEFLDKDVCVVKANGVLTFGVNASTFEALDSLALKHANYIRPSVHGSLDLGLFAVATTSKGGVGFGGDFSSFLGGEVDISGDRALMPIAQVDPCLNQSIPDYASRESVALGNSLLGLPVGVAADYVVDVQSFDYCGHVYDLQEVSGLMVANELFLSNCKCSTTTILTDKNGRPLIDTAIDRARKAKENMEQRVYKWSE